jgi:hypothetical protein
MKTTLTYNLDPYISTIQIPKGGKVKKVITTQSEAFLVVISDNNEDLETRYFKNFIAFQDLPEKHTYIDTYTLNNGYDIFNLYEIEKEDAV